MKCSCGLGHKTLFIHEKKYEVCLKCGLLSKMSELSFEDERKRYDLHQCDENYMEYMKQVYTEIKGLFCEGKILDYGCGQIHILADLIQAEGLLCDYYDLHYFPNEKIQVYSTIILIEVFEHLKEPYEVLKFLISKLQLGGRIILKTKPYDEQNLETWWYLRDETHINFILKDTISFWKLNIKMIYQSGDIFVLERI